MFPSSHRSLGTIDRAFQKTPRGRSHVKAFPSTLYSRDNRTLLEQPLSRLVKEHARTTQRESSIDTISIPSRRRVPRPCARKFATDRAAVSNLSGRPCRAAARAAARATACLLGSRRHHPKTREDSRFFFPHVGRTLGEKSPPEREAFCPTKCPAARRESVFNRACSRARRAPRRERRVAARPPRDAPTRARRGAAPRPGEPWPRSSAYDAFGDTRESTTTTLSRVFF